MTLGRRLLKELSRRGERTDFFSTRECWALRQIDSVDALADFLDRIGYSNVRAGDDVGQVADDLAISGRDSSVWISGGLLDLILAPLSFIFSLARTNRDGAHKTRNALTNRAPEMQNVFDPSDSELRQWAFDKDAVQPAQDWDAAITTDERACLFLELAEDLDCPQGDFFLHCLYLLVGDTVRSSGRAHATGVVNQVIKRAANSEIPEIRQWASQSRKLMRHGSDFDWDAWRYRGEVSPPT